jgi:methionyl-tRNA formyltransferase
VTAPACVVLGYGHFGCVGLEAALAAGARVPLALSHHDNPADDRWWPSFAERCAADAIPVLLDADLAAGSGACARIAALAPDFILSFTFKQLVGGHLLALAGRGGYNLHPSLLPRYRGRAPLNWQLLHGESRVGMTLHRMVERADAGDIVAQEAIEVGPDEDILTVTRRLLARAPAMLERALRELFAGTARHRQQDLAAGSVFGGRRPADGEIDWTRPARAVHNLVRAVAPPWPGAFTWLEGERLLLARSAVAADDGRHGAPGTVLGDGSIACGGGRLTPIALFNSRSRPQTLQPGAILGRPHPGSP